MKLKPLWVNPAVHEKVIKTASETGNKLQPFTERMILEWMINNNNEIKKNKEKKIKMDEYLKSKQ